MPSDQREAVAERVDRAFRATLGAANAAAAAGLEGESEDLLAIVQELMRVQEGLCGRRKYRRAAEQLRIV
jgi:hypothetical protein